jgi:hypothetical protein
MMEAFCGTIERAHSNSYIIPDDELKRRDAMAMPITLKGLVKSINLPALLDRLSKCSQ